MAVWAAGAEMPRVLRRARGEPDEPGGAGHDHGSHQHGPAADSDRRWLWAALSLILVYMAAEIVIGLAADSLALISDAAHMLTDAASIGLVLITMRLAARPPGGRYTYGLKRTEILSAQANGITLIVLALWLAYEAIRRLITPPAVSGGAVIGVALAGIAVNVAITMFVGRASRGPKRSLNLEGAFRHLLTDAEIFNPFILIKEFYFFPLLNYFNCFFQRNLTQTVLSQSNQTGN